MLLALTLRAKVVRSGAPLKSPCKSAVSATEEKSGGIQAIVHAANNTTPIISTCFQVWRRRQRARVDNGASESRCFSLRVLSFVVCILFLSHFQAMSYLKP